MLTRTHIRATRRPLATAVAFAVIASGVAACGAAADSGGMQGMGHGSMASRSPSPAGMPGMNDMPTGDGLAATASGLTFTPTTVSRTLSVAGSTATTPLPAAAGTTQVDGYTITLGSGQLMAGMTHALNVAVSRDGKPVTDLQPYLDTYAHLTAFHDGDLAFAHLHPQGAVNGEHGGPTLTFAATLPKAGNWRLFLQFQTGGILHTAAITLTVSG